MAVVQSEVVKGRNKKPMHCRTIPFELPLWRNQGGSRGEGADGLVSGNLGKFIFWLTVEASVEG